LYFSSLMHLFCDDSKFASLIHSHLSVEKIPQMTKLNPTFSSLLRVLIYLPYEFTPVLIRTL
jgi:hypothetical protein